MRQKIIETKLSLVISSSCKLVWKEKRCDKMFCYPTARCSRSWELTESTADWRVPSHIWTIEPNYERRPQTCLRSVVHHQSTRGDWWWGLKEGNVDWRVHKAHCADMKHLLADFSFCTLDPIKGVDSAPKLLWILKLYSQGRLLESSSPIMRGFCRSQCVGGKQRTAAQQHSQCLQSSDTDQQN